MATRPLSPHTTREAARLAGHKRYFTGEVCRNGHRAERFTSSSGCVDCVNQKVSPIIGRNVMQLPRPVIFPAAGPAPTPELMEFIQQQLQASVPALVAAFYAAHPEQAPRDPFEGYRMSAKAGEATLDSFKKLGWTREQLLAHGYIEPIPTTEGS